MKYVIYDGNEKSICDINMNPLMFEYIIAYIQFEFWDITKDYSLSSSDIINILCNVYGASKVDSINNENYFIIEMNKNWEYYCSAASLIQSIELFSKQKLQFLLNDIYAVMTNKRRSNYTTKKRISQERKSL